MMVMNPDEGLKEKKRKLAALMNACYEQPEWPWVLVYHPEKGLHYYWNVETHEQQWHAPQDWKLSAGQPLKAAPGKLLVLSIGGVCGESAAWRCRRCSGQTSWQRLLQLLTKLLNDHLRLNDRDVYYRSVTNDGPLVRGCNFSTRTQHVSAFLVSERHSAKSMTTKFRHQCRWRGQQTITW